MHLSIPHANGHGHLNAHRHKTWEDNSRKLLIIAGMMMVIVFLVWSMG